MPVPELLPAGGPSRSPERSTGVVIDLQRLPDLPAEPHAPLARYTAAIQRQRGDYNGRVLSLRAEDLRSLSAVYGTSPGEVAEQLLDSGVLACERPPQHDLAQP